MASYARLQRRSKTVPLVTVALFILCYLNGSFAQNFSELYTADPVSVRGVEGVNCTLYDETAQCSTSHTGLGCYNNKCTCLKNIKSRVYGGNININSEWDKALGRCMGLKGSLCDLEGTVLLCKGDLECRKADGHFGSLSMGVGKCGATAIGARVGLVTFMVWVISKISV